MDIRPVSIESVLQANKVVRFIAFTDPILMSDYELVQEVETDAGGVATLTVTPPAGKVLCADCHIPDGSTGHTRYRIFNDNF